MKCPTPFKQIVIDCTDYNISIYQVSDRYFNNNNLSFYVLPSNYKRVQNGSGSSFVSTGQGRQIKAGLIETGFTVELYRPEQNVIYALHSIASQSLKNQTLIQIKDYLRPEAEDFRKGFTIRSGLILALKDIEGSLAVMGEVNANFFPVGCGFTFIESNMRYV